MMVQNLRTSIRKLVIIGALVLAGCVQTDVSSFSDPANQPNLSFKSILVVGAGMTLDERQLAEKTLTKKLLERGVTPISGMKWLPPTRDYSAQEEAEQIAKSGAEALLILALGDKDTVEVYIPPTYHPGTTTSRVSVIGNTAYVTSTTSPGYTTGGGTVSKPRSTYKAALYDLTTGNKVWVADLSSRGAAVVKFSALTISASNSTIEKLVEDGLIP